MRASGRFTVVLILIVAGVLMFRSYRIHSNAAQASEYAPAAAEPILLPSGTVIQAVVGGAGIPETAAAGDEVTAFVIPPIVVDGKSLISSRGRLGGTLESVAISGSEARIRINFTTLLIRGKVFRIEAQPVVTTAPVESDIAMIGEALSTLFGASLGASLGAASRDKDLVDQGLFEGAMSSMSGPDGIPIKVILICDLSV